MTTKFEKYLYKAIKDDPLYELILRDHINQTFSFKNRLENKEQLIVFLKRMIPKMKKCLNKSDDVFNLLPDKIKSELNFMLDDNKYMRVLEYFNKLITPTMNEQKGRGEVFTPFWFIDQMLNDIAEEVWYNPYKKWLDPSNGIGNFPVRIFMRLMETLKNYKDEKLDLTDEENRRKHILENMIYVIELDKKNCFLYKILLGHRGRYKLNIFIGDSLSKNLFQELKKKWGIDFFDIIVGNPPYSTDPSKQNTAPLYNLFIEKFIDKCEHFTFVVPSRWFIGGKGLGKFRKFMLKRKDIKILKHWDNSKDIFGRHVSIEGGVSYFVKDSNYRGLCNFNNIPYNLNNYDFIVKPKYIKFIKRLENYKKLSELYKGRYFGIETNNKNLVDKKIDEEYRICYVSLKQSKDRKKYIKKKFPEKKLDFINKWKVITARANGKKPNFGYKMIGKPNEVHTGSYISFEVNNEKEAESLLSYMNTKFCNFMLSAKKISQDISEKTCQFIPLIPLDRKWNDEDVYKYFNFTDNEIKIIDNN
jgi:hypothetical protein